ncbi:DUF5071 domain-containing protein [Paenibacillus hodogayensis]|uniref:DUF5071 domain-containing protein n=1 Tax=Paenibacillus hodogayensis TaxID=279208 RepID=A0ABV5W2T3_9BACL
MSIRDLIPKHKHDLENVRKIEQYSAVEIIETLPELFEWLQDINWPVAKELTRILPQYGDVLLPHRNSYFGKRDVSNTPTFAT